MQIGAIGGGMAYTPYIYNTNTVNRSSLNKISGIGEDLLESKTDFSALSNNETTNPIKRGETLDFAGILGMQMQMGRMNATRLFKQPEEITQAAGVNEQDKSAQDYAAAQNVTANAVSEADNSSQSASAFDYIKAMQSYQPFNMYI